MELSNRLVQSQEKVQTLFKLSDIEFDVLASLAMGLQNKKIADKRLVTEKTIKWHLTIIYQKLRVTNRVEAILMLGELLGKDIQ